MSILQFIFGVIVIVVAGFVTLCIIAVILESKQLEEENKKLKEDLQKARVRKIQHEYKKAKEVKK